MNLNLMDMTQSDVETYIDNAITKFNKEYNETIEPIILAEIKYIEKFLKSLLADISKIKQYYIPTLSSYRFDISVNCFYPEEVCKKLKPHLNITFGGPHFPNSRISSMYQILIKAKTSPI